MFHFIRVVPDEFYYNPESKKSDEYNQIIMEAMAGGSEAGIKNKEKIVKRIAKEVAIDKE